MMVIDDKFSFDTDLDFKFDFHDDSELKVTLTDEFSSIVKDEVSKAFNQEVDNKEEQKDIKGLTEIIEYACSMKATDIHIIVGSKPAVRVRKVLEDIPFKNVLSQRESELLVNACLPEKSKETLEETGECDFAFTVDDMGRFRANVFKQRGNYSMALRRIPTSIPAFDSLQLPKIMKSFAEYHKGLVLVTGATGSGKSTTLASLLDIINVNNKHHIITIEDPIEYLHTHKNCKINQREIGNDTNSFSAALRAALREDPDVILVGEMRDPETISIALTAAETGHLVFSTLHTVGAAKTIDRIIDSFPAEKQNQVRSQLATVLKAVISQELIPRHDRDGLIAACEVMIVNPAIRSLIREGKPHQINSTIQTNIEQGMQSLDYHLAQLVSKGIISFEDAKIRAQDDVLLLKLIEQGG